MTCSRSYLATKGVKMVLDKWAESHRPKYKQMFRSGTYILKGEYPGCSIVGGEASISVYYDSLVSDDISCSFFDLVQYIYYILVP